MSGALIAVLLFAGAVVFAVLMSLYERKARAREIELAFAGRESLGEEQSYERYFKARGVPSTVAIRVRQIVEPVLDADLSRLSGEDDLSRDLGFFWDYDPMADVMLVIELEKGFGIKFSDEETKTMTTVRDIVEGVWQKFRESLSTAESKTPADTKGKSRKSECQRAGRQGNYDD